MTQLSVLIRPILAACISSLLVWALVPESRAQELTTVRPRPDFNPAFEELGGQVSALVTAPDGKIYAGGLFTKFEGSGRTGLVRLNADGTWDASFSTAATISVVDRLVPLGDGRVLVVGNHVTPDGSFATGLFRMNADASIDAAFGTVTGAGAVALQPDGKILVGGNVVVRGYARLGIARLNADGTLDPSFSPGLWSSGAISAIALQPDGKIIVGGSFTVVDDKPLRSIARLLSTGEVDETFSSGTGFDSVIRTIVAQPDGRLLVGGGFNNYRSQPGRGLVRLNADGSRDTSFLLPPDALRGGVSFLSIAEDGKILATGGFSISNGALANSVVRLTANGAIDSSFSAPPTADWRRLRGAVHSLFSLSGGRYLAAGAFDLAGSDVEAAGGTPHYGIMRLSATGALDETYSPEVRRASAVRQVFAMPDGGWLVTGDFDFVNGEARAGLARVTASGTLDTTFNPAPAFDVLPTAFLVQPDGKVVAAGAFTAFGGAPAGRIVRLDANGSRDVGFLTGSGFDNTVASIARQADGKLVAGGTFGSFNGTGRVRLARLHADGTLDTDFDPGAGPTSVGTAGVTQVAVHSDGRIIVNGYFDAYQGTPRTNLAQVLANGAIDTTFNPGSLFQYTRPELVLAAPGGKVLVGASYFMMAPVNGYVGRLNGDGTLDASFDADTGQPPPLGPVQADGKLFVAGYPFGPGGSSNYFMRVANSGALDPTFSAPGMQSCLTLGASFDAAGHLALAGAWSSFAGFEGNGLILLENSSVPVLAPISMQAGTLGAPFTYSIQAPPGVVSYSATGLPAGLTIDPATGVISGVPLTAGDFSIRVFATGAGGVGTTTMSLRLAKGTASVALENLTATDDGQPHAVSVTTVPANLRVRVTYNGSATPPTALGTYGVVATVLDNTYSGSATGSLQILPSGASVPTITAEPQSQTIRVGSTATLSVSATSASTCTYQWFVGRSGETSRPIEGATSAEFTTPSLHAKASYWVRVQNADGFADSAAALVDVSWGATTGGIFRSGLGSRLYGALGDGYGAHPSLTPIRVGTDCVSVAANAQNTVFLKFDRTLWWAGGTLALPSFQDRLIADARPVQIASDIVKAMASGEAVCALQTDGTLLQIFSNLAVLTFAEGVTDFAVSTGGTVLFVKEDGTLWGAGPNSWGELGVGTTEPHFDAIQIAESVVKVGAGMRHSIFVKADGSLWAMGDNGRGQLGDGTVEARHAPVLVATDVVDAVGGDEHTAFIRTDGTLWTVGANSYGQLGDGTTIDRLSPVVVATEVSTIAAGSWHSLFVKTDGTLWGMGGNAFGALGDDTRIHRSSPIPIDDEVLSVAAGQHHTVYVRRDHTAWAAGYNMLGQLGDGQLGIETQLNHTSDDITAVASSADFTLMLTREGRLLAVGDPVDFSDSDIAQYDPELAREVAQDVASIAVGRMDAAFVKFDGSLWGFGRNAFGELGDGNTSPHGTPTQIAAGVSMVAVGGAHTAYVKRDGSLWTMGANASGQLGRATATPGTPGLVATDVAFVAAGLNHTVFVKKDQTAWAVGDNTRGQLGDGTNESRSTPVQVGTQIRGVSAGDEHTLFVHSNGGLTACGFNLFGQLGTGNTTNSSTPVSVSAGVSAAACGSMHSVFLKTDGTLWGMGKNDLGQLGAGSSLGFTAQQPIRITPRGVHVAAGSSRTFLWQELHPPTILTAPFSYRVDIGGAWTFGTSTLSFAPVTYQWKKDGQPIPGATFTTLSLSSVSIGDDGKYSVVATNIAGSTESRQATLTVNTPPTPPIGLLAEDVGPTSVRIKWTASSDAQGDTIRYGYAVQTDASDWSQELITTDLFATISGLTPSTTYSVRIRASDTSLSSDVVVSTALFTTEPPDVAPVITQEPVGGAVSAGSVAEFAVAATGRPSPQFQWQRRRAGTFDWVDLSETASVSGTTSSTLSVSNVVYAMNGDQFRCIARNRASPEAISASATLLVNPVTVALPSGPAHAGESLVLDATITGFDALAYQWQIFRPEGAAALGAPGVALDNPVGTWVNIDGATTQKLTIPSVQGFNSGRFRVVITTAGGEITSLPIDVMVETIVSATARVMNLSTRALDLQGDNLLIPGFVIEGSGTKRMLIRAVGPGMWDTFKLAGYLADPYLYLRDQTGAQLAANDNWGTSANATEIAAAMASVGAFPLLADSKDSAVLLDLPAGRYTAPTVGVGGATGIAMVELYDADPANTGGARLVNISNRGFVDVGDKIMIPGFVVSSEGSRTFLIRAVGPGLRSTFNLQGVLEDPVLMVFSGASAILSNDNWDNIPGSTTTASVAGQVGAFPLVAGSKDAAFVVTLPPGPYTIQATGKNGSTGVALVEVYLVP